MEGGKGDGDGSAIQLAAGVLIGLKSSQRLAQATATGASLAQYEPLLGTTNDLSTDPSLSLF